LALGVSLGNPWRKFSRPGDVIAPQFSSQRESTLHKKTRSRAKSANAEIFGCGVLGKQPILGVFPAAPSLSGL
jgi:hypothetical protein